MAHFDALTGLPNRVLLADRIRACDGLRTAQPDMARGVLSRPRRLQTGEQIASATRRDSLLVEVADRLRRMLRESDSVARLGGDEFVILLGEIDGFLPCEGARAAPRRPHRRLRGSGTRHLEDLGQRRRDALSPRRCRRRHPAATRRPRHVPGKGRRPGPLSHLRFRRNRNLQLRCQTLARIVCALRDEELTMHYQPKVNMRTGEVLGAEALLRWNDPERGLVPPLEFLPLVENDDLSIDIGAWVLGEVLRQQSCWLADGIEIKVSINISGRHLQQPGFASELERLLRNHPEVPPTLIELEVLETTALSDIARVSEIIGQCRALGVTVSLDDFGTGYSSLTYLRRLPADTLKIDCSFVRDMLADPEDLAIVEAIIGLSEAFQRQVIAEGVETEEHGKLLLRLGCELGQGIRHCAPDAGRRVARMGQGLPPASRLAADRRAALPAPGPPLHVAKFHYGNLVQSVITALASGQPIAPRRQFCSRQANSVTGTATRAARYGALDEFRAVDEAHAALHRLLDAVRLPGAGCARQDAAVMAKRPRQAGGPGTAAPGPRAQAGPLGERNPARTRHPRALPRRRSTLSSRRAFRTRARR